MKDIREQLHKANATAAPDLWDDIVGRRPSPSRAAGRARYAAMGVGVVLGVLVVALLLAIRPSSTDPTHTTAAAPTTLDSNRLLAFARGTHHREGESPRTSLVTIDPASGDTHTLASMDALGTPAWSPDGTRVAYLAGGDLLLLVLGASEPTIVSPCNAATCDGQGSPAWSPDGSTLAFWSDRDGREGLWLVALDGSAPTLLASGLSIGTPAWSPDGRMIAVSGSPTADAEDHSIFLIDSTSGSIIRVIRPEGLQPGFGVTWSPDGGSLAFDAFGAAGRMEGAGIYIIRPTGLGLRLATACSAFASCVDSQPSWSPDGREIAFTRTGDEPGSDGMLGDVYILSLETEDVRAVTQGPGLDCCSAWQAAQT